MISIKTHNVLDYIGGVLILLSPYLFNFSDLEIARNVFIVSGSFLILYSLCTDYRYAIFHMIPVSAHMTLDVLTGVFLLMAPWILNYRGELTATQESLHYVVGLGVFALVTFTRKEMEVGKHRDMGPGTHEPAA